MKKLFLALTLLAGCATVPPQKTVPTPDGKAVTTPRKPAEIGSVTTIDRPLTKFNPADVIEGPVKAFNFKVFTAVYDETHKKVWVGGALYFENVIYRSLLISSSGDGQWEEAEPANPGVANVYLAQTPTHNIINVESLYSGGSSLSSFWKFDVKKQKWSQARVGPAVEQNVFRKAIGCCTQIIMGMEFPQGKWKMKLAGDKMSANFISSSQGRNWAVQGKAETHALQEGQGFLQWRAEPNDRLDEPEKKIIELEFASKSIHLAIPRYWNTFVRGQKVTLSPVL